MKTNSPTAKLTDSDGEDDIAVELKFNNITNTLTESDSSAGTVTTTTTTNLISSTTTKTSDILTDPRFLGAVCVVLLLVFALSFFLCRAPDSAETQTDAETETSETNTTSLKATGSKLKTRKSKETDTKSGKLRSGGASGSKKVQSGENKS